MIRFKITGAAVAGTEHRSEGKACEDAIAFSRDNDCAAIALCDGAGSLPGSEKIAKALSSDISRFLCEYFDDVYYDYNKEKVVYNACLRTIKDTIKEGEDIACTLLAAARKDDRLIYVHVGDGIILGMNDNKTAVLSYPENGDTASETFFVRENMDMSRIRVMTVHSAPYDCILLASDGAEEAIYEKHTERIGDAVRKFRHWSLHAEEQNVSRHIEKALDEVFRDASYDDMSVVLLTSENSEIFRTQNT